MFLYMSVSNFTSGLVSSLPNFKNLYSPLGSS
nr:MAG TPA: hypothetical protein [Caudoviricetes sp.]